MPGKVQLWVDANPSVKKWFDKKANDSKNTAAVYASHLFGYGKTA